MNDKAHETVRQVIEIVPAVMQVVTAELRQGQYPIVPTQLGILTMLAHHPCNLSELAEHHYVSLPTMSNSISKMVEQGWVERTRSPHDRRMLLINITSDGQAVLKQIAQHVASRMLKLLSILSAEEQDTLSAGLDVLKKVLAVMPQPFPIDFKELS